MILVRRLFLTLALLLTAAPALAADLPAVTSADRVLGRADAPVTVVEYASFTCPHCAHWHLDVLPAFKAKYIDTGKVKLVFRDLPTAPAQQAVNAAVIARCAEPTRFFDVASSLMHGQAAMLSGGDQMDWYQAAIAASGRTAEQIEACRDQPQSIATLRASIDGAVAAGVAGTPTFFVNGEKTANGELATLSAAIDPLLPR